MSKEFDPNIGKDTQFQPGESGNPNGKPKGSKDLKTIIRELENEDFDWKLVPIRKKAKAMKAKSPFRAIVNVAIARALVGDVRAMEWLRKAGYGDSLKVDGQIKTTVALVEFLDTEEKDNAGADTESQG